VGRCGKLWTGPEQEERREEERRRPGRKKKRGEKQNRKDDFLRDFSNKCFLNFLFSIALFKIKHEVHCKERYA
jgi:hypothetical protein